MTLKFAKTSQKAKKRTTKACNITKTSKTSKLPAENADI